MEINNHSYPTHRQHRPISSAAQNNIPTIKSLSNERPKGKAKTGVLTTVESNTGIQANSEKLQTRQPASMSHPLILTSPHQQTEHEVTDYPVSVHENKMSLASEQAINTYRAIEDSHDGQELVNRIELTV